MPVSFNSALKLYLETSEKDAVRCYRLNDTLHSENKYTFDTKISSRLYFPLTTRNILLSLFYCETRISTFGIENHIT